MRKLEWDSRFWGTNIFAIKESDLVDDKDVVNEMIKGTNSYLIQALLPDNNIEQINLFEEKGFRLVESKISLIKNICQEENLDIDNYKIVEKHDVLKHKDEFYCMYGELSRYSIFSKEKVNDFYYTWIINSIEGVMDDKCIGYYVEDELAGFITYRFNDDHIQIGLVGVFPKYRKKGISKKVLAYANNDAMLHQHKRILISTQGTNLKAINAYIKSGFIFDNIKYWYYKIGGEQ